MYINLSAIVLSPKIPDCKYDIRVIYVFKCEFHGAKSWRGTGYLEKQSFFVDNNYTKNTLQVSVYIYRIVLQYYDFYFNIRSKLDIDAIYDFSVWLSIFIDLKAILEKY